MYARWTVSLFACLVLSACASRPELKPAPGAEELASGPGSGARASAAGVTVEARAGAWSGFPETLDEVTPLLLAVANDGDVPVRVRYAEIGLATQDGVRLAALPPLALDEEQVEPVESVPYSWSGFYVAPYGAHYYPEHEAWAGGFLVDRVYYDTHYPALRRVDLPTPDMIRRALPEGVVEPGGRVMGFVYFQELPEGAEQATLTMDVVHAATGRTIDTVRIPFVVD
ncbi:MAG: hypothetical protein ACQEXJ_06535 [Myxococcota bacterium]